MTREELARCDGRDGRKALVAVNGNIYDVTDSPLWKGGNHQQLHQAGSDLSEALKKAPHVRTVIERFPLIGQLDANQPAPTGGKLPLLVIGAVVVLALVVLMLALR